jgi:hypothetical protein
LRPPGEQSKKCQNKQATSAAGLVVLSIFHYRVKRETQPVESGYDYTYFGNSGRLLNNLFNRISGE